MYVCMYVLYSPPFSEEIHKLKKLCTTVIASHFEKLGNPSPEGNDFDCNNEKYVEKAIREIVSDKHTEGQSIDTDDPVFCSMITYDEVLKVCNELKPRKAEGYDGVTGEHIKYGGEYLITVLVNIFRAMVRLEYVPVNFKRSVFIPIFKGGNKDPLCKDDYRGISLTTILSRVWDKVIYYRLKKWLLQINYPHPLQCAIREGVSCLNASFLIQEAVGYLKESGEKLFVAFLDTRKAFDTVWIDGMMFKLHGLEIGRAHV